MTEQHLKEAIRENLLKKKLIDIEITRLQRQLIQLVLTEISWKDLEEYVRYKNNSRSYYNPCVVRATETEIFEYETCFINENNILQVGAYENNDRYRRSQKLTIFKDFRTYEVASQSMQITI